MQTVDMIGYIATILLVVSFIPRKVKLIRSINFFACVSFVIYGILLGMKWPIIISNGIIACIHFYHIFLSRPKTTNL